MCTSGLIVVFGGAAIDQLTADECGGGECDGLGAGFVVFDGVQYRTLIFVLVYPCLYLRLLCIVNGIGGNIYLNLEVIFAAVVVVPFGDAAFCEQDAYKLLERGRCAEVGVECQGAGNKLTFVSTGKVSS